MIVKQELISHFGGETFFGRLPNKFSELADKVFLLCEYLKSVFGGSKTKLVV